MKQFPRVDSARYEFAHGRKPSGVGRWAFALSPESRLEQAFISPCLPYAKAVRLARRHFAGAFVIFPLS